MESLRLALRNAFRHRLRTGLTVLGLVIAIVAFGLLQTVVDAWYAGAEGASNTRLITRNSISLVFPLPITYRDKIRRVPGVTGVSMANWFAGVYISERNFFPQFAVDPNSYFELFPEYLVPEEELLAFKRDRKGAIVGRKLADTYGFRIGDVVPLRGTIYAGTWSFVVRGIYDGAEKSTDTSQFFFHWDYLNETIKRTAPKLGDNTGIYIVRIAAPDLASEVAASIDGEFRNSLAETLTETEKAFQLSFVAMTEAIVVAIRIVSFLVIFIILAVMANTMAMTARERTAEYATLKALGFGPGFVSRLVFGESLAIALAGGAVGVALTFPAAGAFAERVGTLFPVFNVSRETIGMQLAAALAVGCAAAIVPAVRASRVRIAAGLRAIG